MGEFFAIRSDPHETIRSWLRTTCEQALYYEEHHDRFLSRYAGTYILLQTGDVRWSDREGTIGISRRELAGDRPEEALWLKYVDPDEAEGERFDVYRDTLRRLRELDGLDGGGRG
jgi:hypothetical protein